MWEGHRRRNWKINFPEDVASVQIRCCLFPVHQVLGITSSFILNDIFHLVNIITFFTDKKTKIQRN